jgi:hypothetical protein
MNRFICILSLIANLSITSQSQSLLWPNGNEFITLGANEAVTIDFGQILYINNCSNPDGIDDFIFRFADVYIIPSGTPLNIGDVLVDIAGIPNTVEAPTSGGVFVSETIGFTEPTGFIGAGTYMVIYDECQDGILDNEDTVFDPAFSVQIPADVPPIGNYIVQLKEDAASQAAHWFSFYLPLKTLSTFLEYKDLVICILIPSISCVIELIADFVQEKEQDALKGAVGLTSDPEEAVLNHIKNNYQHYLGIAADPPDPNFQQLTPLIFREQIGVKSNDPLIISLAALGTYASNEESLTLALLRSLERYQGADATNNGDWALIHARAIKDYANLLSAQLTRTKSELENLSAVHQNYTADFDQAGVQAELSRARIENSGFDADEVRFLLNQGFNEVQIDALRDSIIQFNFSDYSEATFLVNITALIASINSTKITLDNLATDVTDIITYFENQSAINDHAPVANATRATKALRFYSTPMLPPLQLLSYCTNGIWMATVHSTTPPAQRLLIPTISLLKVS